VIERRERLLHLLRSVPGTSRQILRRNPRSAFGVLRKSALVPHSQIEAHHCRIGKTGLYLVAL
jgi:hypothetical protein